MRRVIPLLLALLAASASAYSLFSLGRPGEPVSPSDARGAAMGDTSLGLWDYYNYTLLNPANIAGLEYSVLTLTTQREHNTYNVGAGESVYVSSGLPNIQLAVGFSGGWSIALGWRERQSWRFRYTTSLDDPVDGGSVGSVDVEGRGAVNSANLALAWAPNDNLGLGLRVSGIIGDPHERWTADYDEDDYVTTTDELGCEVRGLAVGAGTNLRFDSLTAGAYFEVPVLSDVTRITESGFGEVSRETTEFSYPINFGAGLGFKPQENLQLVGDVRYEMWSGFSIGEEELGYDDALHLGLGLEYIPTRRYNAFFLWRMPLRLGGYYKTLYDAPQGSGSFAEWGVTTGLGMFFGTDDQSTVDVAFQYAQRGSLEETGLEETFLRLMFTFNGADKWFQ